MVVRSYQCFQKIYWGGRATMKMKNERFSVGWSGGCKTRVNLIGFHFQNTTILVAPPMINSNPHGLAGIVGNKVTLDMIIWSSTPKANYWPHVKIYDNSSWGQLLTGFLNHVLWCSCRCIYGRWLVVLVFLVILQSRVLPTSPENLYQPRTNPRRSILRWLRSSNSKLLPWFLPG